MTAQTTPLNLALQGGGAHGAFTWGVLDALLEDADFDFDGVSGTSAGAMNALCLAHGLMTGGRDGARETLARFWTSVAASSPFAPSGEGGAGMSQALKLMLQWTNHLSPEQLNPFDLNTLLASACLPTIHRTIVIDGEPYWDGGYSANPAVFPLAWQCASPDILLVLLTPLRYTETPVSAEDIRQRLLELSFNSTFLREMRMFAHLREEARISWLSKWLPGGRLERRISQLRFHAITADALLGELPAGSKLAVNLPFFERLRDSGREHAQAWLDAHRSQVGHSATLDLEHLFY